MGAPVQQRRGGIIEGINVTPLVDIVLVLLLVFIVTAKMVVNTPAVPLDLPKAKNSEELQTIFSVSMPADGTLHVDGAAIPEGKLEELARRALADDAELRAVIQADETVPHGKVIRVLDTLKEAGIARVAFGATALDEGADVAKRP